MEESVIPMFNLLLIVGTLITQVAEMVSFAALRAGWMLTGAAGYAITALVAGAAMAVPGAGLAVFNGLWNAFSNVAGGIVGVLLFGEVLGRTKVLGLALGVLSAILLSMA